MRLPESDVLGIDALLDRIYPVGIVLPFDRDENPSALGLPGVWQAFGVGRMLVGLDAGQAEFDALGETGGSKTVTLTTAQMPGHTHTQNAHTHVQDPHSHAEQLQGNTTAATTGTNVMGSTATGGSLRTAGQSTAQTTAVNQNATATNQSTGGDQPHPNLPPYVVVRYWKRVS